ncbi:hypothetical protein Hanom_Chr00s002004g01690661 [Helianthus anomalus]
MVSTCFDPTYFDRTCVDMLTDPTYELQSNRSNVTNCYENLFDLQDYTYVKLDRLDELEITKFGNIKPGSLFFEAYVGKVMYAKEIAVI